ncbi:MAG: homocysteine S-methyltransferase [Planctomycetes bacterium]|nr:homocysteine S-methyltransferase [Planctomycetota bacterium]
MASNPLQALLDARGTVVLDGALATELERRGADLDDPLWSARLLIDEPERIREVHREYFAAGADIATTASYQATFAGFARRGLDAQSAACLLRLSVQLAREARDEFLAAVGPRDAVPLVAASCGCYGAALHDGSEYRGDYGLSRQQLSDFHRPRLESLLESEPDLLAFETIPCLIEAEAIVRLLENYPHVSAWLSFSCRDERHVCHGERLHECLVVAESAPQVTAAGINCTPPRFVNALLESLAGHACKPLIVYPNRGESWDAPHRRWLPGPAMPGDWGQAARQWRARGARIIGGCCRTTPADIRALRLAMEAGSFDV